MNQFLENFIKNTFNLLAVEFWKLVIYAYDICNEVFQVMGGGLRTPAESKWMEIYGHESFIINAFTYAIKYAPS